MAPRRPPPAARAGSALCATALVLGGSALVHSSLLSARHVVVSGERETTAAAVIAASGLTGAPPLIDIDSASVASAVERLPWVKRAVVRREWPESVKITVTESVPIAYASGAKGSALVDADGRVLAELSPGARLPADLVPLGALPTPIPGAFVAPSEAAVLTVAGALPLSVLPQVAALTRLPELGVVAETHSGAEVVFGPAADLSAKMVALVTVLKSTSLAARQRLDLRVPAAPVLTR